MVEVAGERRRAARGEAAAARRSCVRAAEGEGRGRSEVGEKRGAGSQHERSSESTGRAWRCDLAGVASRMRRTFGEASTRREGERRRRRAGLSAAGGRRSGRREAAGFQTGWSGKTLKSRLQSAGSDRQVIETGPCEVNKPPPHASRYSTCLRSPGLLHCCSPPSVRACPTLPA